MKLNLYGFSKPCIIKSRHRYVLNRKMMNANGIRTAWECNSPETLVDSSIRSILHHPSILFYAIEVSRSDQSLVSRTNRKSKKGRLNVVEHDDCISKNATLVSIHSNDENSFIKSLISGVGWTGLIKVHKGGQRGWSDATSYDYTNWRNGGEFI